MVRGAILSVAAGMIGALGLPLFIALFFSLSSYLRNDSEMVGLIAEFVGVVIAGCLAVMIANLILVVLPLTAYLRSTDQESGAAYRWSGSVIGVSEVILMGAVMAVHWSGIVLYAIFGAISGFAMAQTWWLAYRRDEIQAC